MRYVTTDAIHVDTSDNSAYRQPVYRGGTLRTALLASANSPVSAKDVKRYTLLATGAVMELPDEQPPAIAQSGNADYVRQGVDTTAPGIQDGPNLKGTVYEHNPEALGLEGNVAYKRQVQPEDAA